MSRRNVTQPTVDSVLPYITQKNHQELSAMFPRLFQRTIGREIREGRTVVLMEAA